MKKLTALFLGALLAFSLTACGNTQSNDTVTDSAARKTTGSTESENAASTSPEAAAPETSGAESTASEETEEDSGKILVVYYSASGNTERVANDLADTLNADVFELIPENPYTDEDLDWTKDGSRVNQEHDDETLRDIPLVQNTVENWDEYDTVFIGYPKMEHPFLCV